MPSDDKKRSRMRCFFLFFGGKKNVIWCIDRAFLLIFILHIAPYCSILLLLFFGMQSWIENDRGWARGDNSGFRDNTRHGRCRKWPHRMYHINMCIASEIGGLISNLEQLLSVPRTVFLEKNSGICIVSYSISI